MPTQRGRHGITFYAGRRLVNDKGHSARPSPTTRSWDRTRSMCPPSWGLGMLGCVGTVESLHGCTGRPKAYYLKHPCRTTSFLPTTWNLDWLYRSHCLPLSPARTRHGLMLAP